MTHQNQDSSFPECNSVDRSVLELLQLGDTVAKSKATVLISGEAGCGKKTFAHYIFQKSQRAQKKLKILNIKDLSKGEQLASLETALTEALGGTLVLAEVGYLSSAAQGRLFQAIQDNADVRFLVTTSRNLNLLVKQNEFREDLFYRLNVVNVKIPNLAERIGDIEFYARHFVAKWAQVHHKGTLELSSDAIQLLNSHRWPGNIRELESTLERAVLLAEGGLIRAKQIQIQVVTDGKATLEQAVLSSWKPGRTLNEIERNVILEALKHHSGNRTHTAKALGISIRTLRNKLAEYRVMGIHA